MSSAPLEPMIDSPSGAADPRRICMGPEVALLVIVDDHAEQVADLIRARWRHAGDEPGCWWDFDNGEAISLAPIGWAPMQTKDEMAMLLVAARGL